ncbi:MAG TPA: hypothetical protein VJJ22_02935 [Candidatus Paceibacterota bacterium]
MNTYKINKQSGNGTIVAIVVILIILVVGAIYVWKSNKVTPLDDSNQAVENEIPTDESLTQTQTNLEAQNTADDLGSIETDLNATTFSDI